MALVNRGSSELEEKGAGEGIWQSPPRLVHVLRVTHPQVQPAAGPRGQHPL